MDKLIYINNFLHLLGISIWIGSIIFFSFGVAGTVFKNITSKTEAGKLNGIFLKKLNKVEQISVTLLALTFGVYLTNAEYRTDNLFLRLITFWIMLIIYLVYSTHITKKTEQLRDKIVDFDNLESTPERIEFNKYHKMYVKLLSANLLLGFVLLFLTGISLKI